MCLSFIKYMTVGSIIISCVLGLLALACIAALIIVVGSAEGWIHDEQEREDWERHQYGVSFKEYKELINNNKDL